MKAAGQVPAAFMRLPDRHELIVDDFGLRLWAGSGKAET